MTQPSQSKNIVANGREPGDLLGRTLRTMAILVGACVLFVGSLSTAAVVIAHKATAAPADEKAEAPSVAETAGTKSAAPKKPASTLPRAGVGSQSI
ncbi:MAG TPA: hypothetical protein VM925_11075 [Labilithrix sp.]|nr:hypothetical protein [Labilithrix sp.]